MDAIILCSGFGTRLGAVGAVHPKPLLMVNEKPVLEYIADSIERIDEIEKVVITSNKKFAEKYQKWVEEKRKKGYGKELELVIEPVMRNEDRLGAIGSTANAIEKANIRGDVLIIAGDNFHTFDMAQVMKEFLAKRTPGIVVYDVRSLEDAKRFGVVRVENGIIKEMEEKPERPKSTLISTAIYFLPRHSIELMGRYVRETKQTDALGSFVMWLAAHESVRAIVPKTGKWVDIGSIKGYTQARFLSKHHYSSAPKPRNSYKGSKA